MAYFVQSILISFITTDGPYSCMRSRIDPQLRRQLENEVNEGQLEEIAHNLDVDFVLPIGRLVRSLSQKTSSGFMILLYHNDMRHWFEVYLKKLKKTDSVKETAQDLLHRAVFDRRVMFIRPLIEFGAVPDLSLVHLVLETKPEESDMDKWAMITQLTWPKATA